MSMARINAGFFQFSPVFGNIQHNLETILKAIQTFSGHLLVFPELAFSGYQFVSRNEVQDLAEVIPSGSTIKAMEKALRGRDLHVVIGLAERDHDHFYNSAILIGPNGYIGTYRKIHLFFEETIWFSPGDTGFRVWDIGRVRLGVLVCFDWFFPEAARSLALKGADILCHPSNLVLPYCPDAMVTRCLENGVFAITANRVGREQREEKPALEFIGMSEIVAPNGGILCRSPHKNQELSYCELDIAEARDKQINPYNDLLKDRRPHWYVS
jgi:predicted amidohydrolase